MRNEHTMTTSTRRFSEILTVVVFSLMLAGCGPNLIERVTNFWTLSCCGGVVVILDILALVELAGSSKSTGSKLLWALLIVFAPVLGCILYYFFGRS